MFRRCFQSSRSRFLLLFIVANRGTLAHFDISCSRPQKNRRWIEFRSARHAARAFFLRLDRGSFFRFFCRDLVDEVRFLLLPAASKIFSIDTPSLVLLFQPLLSHRFLFFNCSIEARKKGKKENSSRGMVIAARPVYSLEQTPPGNIALLTRFIFRGWTRLTSFNSASRLAILSHFSGRNFRSVEAAQCGISCFNETYCDLQRLNLFNGIYRRAFELVTWTDIPCVKFLDTRTVDKIIVRWSRLKSLSFVFRKRSKLEIRNNTM